ncbi:MAG: NAD(+)/NADH kinase [Actinobacteria bacterium]|nr:NAD(+)/NADH kinase [Actinomycetota bacterium]
MSCIGFVVHHTREEAGALVRGLAVELAAEGHEVRLPLDDAATIGLDGLGTADAAFPDGLDVVVSVGGDGTMLRAVDLVAAKGTPVIGVNVGQLGYLTEVEPEAAGASIRRFLAGDHGIDERMLLSVRVQRAGEPSATPATLALNEAVLEKTPLGHTVRLVVELDGTFFTTYAADGLIVATPTGSTAYAFSARGPIVAPGHRALLLTPVSPHMLFDRTLVLEPATELRVTVQGHRPATLSVDGRNLGELREGDSLSCSAADVNARIVCFARRDFHRILKAKFGLEDR